MAGSPRQTLLEVEQLKLSALFLFACLQISPIVGVVARIAGLSVPFQLSKERQPLLDGVGRAMHLFFGT